jgi:hypothetical protein
MRVVEAKRVVLVLTTDRSEHLPRFITAPDAKRQGFPDPWEAWLRPGLSPNEAE